MRCQRHIQTLHTQLPEKVPGIDALGAGVQLAGVVIPHKAVMAKVHHQRVPLLSVFQLANQNGITVAYIDKVQSQHHTIPFLFCCLHYTTPALYLQRKADFVLSKNSHRNLTVLTRKADAGHLCPASAVSYYFPIQLLSS